MYLLIKIQDKAGVIQRMHNLCLEDNSSHIYNLTSIYRHAAMLTFVN